MASLSGWRLNRDLDGVRVCTCRCLEGRVLGRGDDKDTSSEAPPGLSWKPSHLSSGKGRQVIGHMGTQTMGNSLDFPVSIGGPSGRC